MKKMGKSMVVVLVLVVAVAAGGVANATPRNMGYDEVSVENFCERFLTDLERGRLNATAQQYVKAFADAGYPFKDAHDLAQFLAWAGLVKRLDRDTTLTVAYLDGDRIVWRTRRVKAGEWAIKDGSEPFNWLVLLPWGNVIKAQSRKLLPGPRIYLQAPSYGECCGELRSRLTELERIVAELRQAAPPADSCEDLGARERIAALETEIAGLKERVAVLEGRQDGDDAEILVLRDEISQLRQQVVSLAQGLDEVRGDVEEIRTILPLSSSQPVAVVKKHHRNWLPWLLGVGVGYLIFHNGGGGGCGGGPAPLPPNGPALPPN